MGTSVRKACGLEHFVPFMETMRNTKLLTSSHSLATISLVTVAAVELLNVYNFLYSNGRKYLRLQ